MFKNPLTLEYSFKHIIARKTQVIMTIGGIALVVFVFAATLMLAAGLDAAMEGTGSEDNVIVTRSGSRNEVRSSITREVANILMTEPEIAKDEAGKRLLTTDMLFLITMLKKADEKMSNISIRGITQQGLKIRSQVKITEGRMFNQGTKEVIVGSGVNRKFMHSAIGDKIRVSGTDLTVVGIFDAGTSAFNSEIWGDVNILMPIFRREDFSSITFKLAEGASVTELEERLKTDPRMVVSVAIEKDFFASQSEDLSQFIRFLGSFVSIIFSIGAVIGAMITMYSSVANRVREIGVLRAIGFTKGLIFGAFIQESFLMGLLGGVVGLFLVSWLSFVNFATTNFSTFSDISFKFQMTPMIVVYGMIFSCLMGIIGGALPSWRAARIPVLQALRE